MKKILEYKLYYRRSLPHFQPANAIFFITYRLAFVLPQNLIDRIFERFRILSQKKKLSNEEMWKIEFGYIDEYLHLCENGPRYLMDDRIAEFIKSSLLKMAHKQYKLFCFCIMPNHAHILIQPIEKTSGGFYSIPEIMKGHKGSTARSSNNALKRHGTFWHHENYDHWIRTQEEFDRVVWYIIKNPVKTRLIENWIDWPHTWLNEDLKTKLAP